MERKKMKQNISCGQAIARGEGCRQAPFLDDLLSYKKLSTDEQEKLYNVLCWLCIGLTRCRQQNTCQSTCCKGKNAVTETSRAFAQPLDSSSICDQKNVAVTVASFVHPEIASKLNI